MRCSSSTRAWCPSPKPHADANANPPRSHGAALLPAQVPSTFPEDLDKSQYTPESYVVENAKQKALEVHSRLTGTGEEPPQPRP